MSNTISFDQLPLMHNTVAIIDCEGELAETVAICRGDEAHRFDSERYVVCAIDNGDAALHQDSVMDFYEYDLTDCSAYEAEPGVIPILATRAFKDWNMSGLREVECSETELVIFANTTKLDYTL